MHVILKNQPILTCAVALAITTLLAAATPTRAHCTEVDEASVVASEEEILDQGVALLPLLQEVSFKSINHPVLVSGSTLTDEALRKELKPFRQTVRAIEEAGLNVGVAILDLGTGASLTYHADDPFYPASSIKGPYTIAAYQELVKKGKKGSRNRLRPLAEPTIVYSDNEAYSSMRSQLGGDFFASWCADGGVIARDTDEYDRFVTRNYPTITARQLASMWKHASTYLDGGSKGAQDLLSFFERREVSPIREGVGGDVLTITKAGWYPNDGYGVPATCDAGIVATDGHVYVVAIMTDMPDDLAGLADAVPSLLAAVNVLW